MARRLLMRVNYCEYLYLYYILALLKGEIMIIKFLELFQEFIRSIKMNIILDLQMILEKILIL